MNPIQLNQVRRLQSLLTRANAALTPLASDGEGRDAHGGRIKHGRRCLLNALDDVRMAAVVAEEIQTLTEPTHDRA